MADISIFLLVAHHCHILTITVCTLACFSESVNSWLQEVHRRKNRLKFSGGQAVVIVAHATYYE